MMDEKMRDGKLTQERWIDLIRFVHWMESSFPDEEPPPHIRENAINEFSKRYGVERHRVAAALDAWDAESGTLH